MVVNDDIRDNQNSINEDVWNWLRNSNMTEDDIVDLTVRSQCRNTLYDREDSRDVVFLVGVEPDVWRIPGHKSVLGKNPVFRAMLEGPLANKEMTTIVIEDVEGKAFDLLLGFLYTSRIEFSSVNTALATLYAANKYLCAELVRICIRYLDENMNVQSVLQIYQHSRMYSSILNFPSDVINLSSSCFETNDNKNGNYDSLSSPLPSITTGSNTSADAEKQLFAAAAGSRTTKTANNDSSINNDIDNTVESEEQDDNSKYATMANDCSWLLFNCYHFIDDNADEVLGHEYVEDLTKDALYDIARRQSLAVSSELHLFFAICRWCNRECKRKHLELTKENQLQVLGDQLLFAVRYLLMDYAEYLDGPLQSGLFDKNQNTILLGRILDKSVDHAVQADGITADVLERLHKERSSPFVDNILPAPLSMRSYEYRTSFHKRKKAGSAELKTCRRKKDGKKDGSGKNRKEKRDSRCLDYTLHVLAYIFD